jgi:hypothetical protein
MSWFDRLREFKEGEDILADDFETEFDNVQAGLNRLIQMGSVSASGSSGLPVTSTEGDVPGTTVSLAPEIASLVKVDIVLNLELLSANGGVNSAFGWLSVDGTKQTPAAVQELLSWSTPNADSVQSCVGQSFVVPLAAGSHTLKIRVKSTGGATLWPADTTLTYLMVPNPSP